MIKNYKKFSDFENEFISKKKVDIDENFFIMEEMYNEAVSLGVIPVKNLLEDIEFDIRLAKILNSVQETNS